MVSFVNGRGVKPSLMTPLWRASENIFQQKECQSAEGIWSKLGQESGAGSLSACPYSFLAEINLRRCTFNLKVVKLILNRDFYLGEQTTSNKPCIKLIKPYVPKLFSLFNRLCGQTIVGGPKIALTSLIYGNSNFQLCNIHDCDFTDFGIWWFLIVTSTFL